MTTPTRPLSLTDSYSCPVCRLGQITPLALMDALACSTCRHIFEADLAQQVIHLAGSRSPLSWRWSGQTWLPADGQGLSLVDKLLAVLVVSLPTLLIGLSAYSFHPHPTNFLDWFPFVWTGLTFICHLACVLGVLISYYQISLWAMVRAGLSWRG